MRYFMHPGNKHCIFFAKNTVVANHPASPTGKSAGFTHTRTCKDLLNKQRAKNGTLWRKKYFNAACPFSFGYGKLILSTGTFN